MRWFPFAVGLVAAGFAIALPTIVSAEEPLTYRTARVCVTGYDTNRPATFPGIGDFIGWTGGAVRAANGDLLVCHSAGYWHVSFAQPRKIADATRKRWAESGWPLDFPAPTGGRSMLVRSTDNGRTWSKPDTILDHRLDDGPVSMFLCSDGTLLCFVNVQASWYGFREAPMEYKNDLGGLNTKQCVLRSQDHGRNWSEPIWIDGPGTFYERSHAQPVELPDGGILWPTYCSDQGREQLYGVIHRSDDFGKTWRPISQIHREGKNVDEPAIARMRSGKILLVSRPDGGIFLSDDEAKSWTPAGHVVKSGRFKAPRLFVLQDDTLVCAATWQGQLFVVLSSDEGASWTKPISLDPTCYGYPGGFIDDDGSIVLSYSQSGKAPNRVFVIRFAVNADRKGIQLYPLTRRDE